MWAIFPASDEVDLEAPARILDGGDHTQKRREMDDASMAFVTGIAIRPKLIRHSEGLPPPIFEFGRGLAQADDRRRSTNKLVA